MPIGYILNNKKTFEVFLKTEKVLKSGHFPLMSRFANEEISFWIKTAKEYIEKDEKIIEMGCGSGRVIKELIKAGFFADGFDNNTLFVDYCKKQNLNTFYLDATKKIPKKHKFKYKIAGVALNTLFNFPKKIRKRWISSAYDLLKPKGILIATAYADTKFSRATIKERIKYYRNVLSLPKSYDVEFFDDGKRKGISLYDNHQKNIWFSEWRSKKELLEEIVSWEKFKIISIKPMKCKIAWFLLLIKK